MGPDQVQPEVRPTSEVGGERDVALLLGHCQLRAQIACSGYIQKIRLMRSVFLRLRCSVGASRIQVARVFFNSAGQR